MERTCLNCHNRFPDVERCWVGRICGEHQWSRPALLDALSSTQSQLAQAREDLSAANSALVESLEARQITEAEGGPVQQLNTMIDALKADLAQAREELERAKQNHLRRMLDSLDEVHSRAWQTFRASDRSHLGAASPRPEQIQSRLDRFAARLRAALTPTTKADPPHVCTSETCDEIPHSRDDVVMKMQCRVCGHTSEHEVPE